MRFQLISFFCFFISICLSISTRGQMPVCGVNNIIYFVDANGSIYNYDPSQPLSSVNPSQNTISLAPGAIQCIAVNNNLNATSPSPTFYTIVSGNYYYYNGSGWTNTGHNAGPNSNIGGAGPYLYNTNTLTNGTVYKYDGTANATLVLNLPPNSCVADVVGDCLGNFYMFNPDTLGGQWLRKYSPSGTLQQSWTLTSLPHSPWGGGLAIIGNELYFDNISGLWKGQIGSSSITFSQITSAGLNPGPEDFASCVLDINPVTSTDGDTVNYCSGNPVKEIHASGVGSYIWSVLSGPAVITGSGDSVSFSTVANAKIVLSTSLVNRCTHSQDTIVLTVNSIHAPPVAGMTTTPSVYVSGDTVTFRGHIAGSHSGLTYSWTKNRSKINGATDSVYTTANLLASDTICFIVYSPVPCTVPDSSVVCVKVGALDVSKIGGVENSIEVWPNPAQGSLSVSLSQGDGNVILYDAIGRRVYQIYVRRGTTTIDVGGLKSGIYFLQFVNTEGGRYVRKILKE